MARRDRRYFASPLRPTRRAWLQQTLPPLLAVAWPWRPARAAPYPVTAEAMRTARETEMGVYHRYTEFGRRAQADGYRGVAYLFAAFAAAEFIHASNFGRVLSRLNVEVPPLARPEVKAGSTRDNLLVAAGLEAASVDEFYPALLEKLRPEGHEDAMTVVQWAWNTEKQHREKIRQIQRWSPAFFEQVAKHIDTKTGQYFVCQICGNTVNRVPPGNCQVCGNPNKHFRLIDPPA